MALEKNETTENKSYPEVERLGKRKRVAEDSEEWLFMTISGLTRQDEPKEKKEEELCEKIDRVNERYAWKDQEALGNDKEMKKMMNFYAKEYKKHGVGISEGKRKKAPDLSKEERDRISWENHKLFAYGSEALLEDDKTISASNDKENRKNGK